MKTLILATYLTVGYFIARATVRSLYADDTEPDRWEIRDSTDIVGAVLISIIVLLAWPVLLAAFGVFLWASAKADR